MSEEEKKPGFFRRNGARFGRYYGQAAGYEDIRHGGRLIRDLFRLIRAAPNAPQGTDAGYHPWQGDERRFDIEAMAMARGIAPERVEGMILNRRKQTAKAVWCYLGGASFLLVAWIYKAVTEPLGYTGILPVLAVLSICSALLLAAYHNALVNWQCRTRRFGTSREFLNTEDSWWPS